ncbi:MAG TPA: HAD family hydrolase, partial [Gaiellaceae bacterium]|nr:HAD family hydrolase [Gaiellaceae bacterium]
ELIERRSAELPIYIASATPEEEVRALVDARGLGPYVTVAYGAPTPKADILRCIAARERCDPSTLLFVGDSATDERAAIEAGVRFVGRVPNGNASPFTQPDLTTVADLGALDGLWQTLG